MAILTKAQLEALNQSSFPDQSTEAITPAILRNYNTQTIDTLVDSLDTGSFTTDAEFNAFTSSTNSSITQLNASSASQQVSINALNAATASYATSAITASSLITASVNLNTITFTKGNGSTFDVTVNTGSGGGGTTDISSLNAFTASQLTINSGLNASTASQQISIDNLNTTTASINSSITQLNASSASQQISINNLNSTTASINSSITQLNASSASQQISINALNAATSSYVTSAITASSLITASVSGQTMTFTKGNGTTFDVTLPAGSGSTTIPTGTVSSSAQITGLGFVSSSVTASSLVTASVNLNTITFTKGDASTFNITVNTGSGGGTTDISSLNAFTASQETKNSTLASVTASLNANTASQQSQINSLIAATGSYALTSSIVPLTSLNAFTASQETKDATLASVTSSLNSSITQLNASSASQQISINALNAATSSYITTPLTSLNAYTASNDTKWSTLGGQTGSYVTSAITASSLITASFSVNTLTFTKGDGTTFGVVIPDVSGSTLPSGLLSSSVTNFTDYSASVDSRINAITSSGGISAGTVSSSIQIVELGFLQTSSFNSYTASTDSSISQLNASSASQQISINAINSVSGSWITESETGSFVTTNTTQTISAFKEFTNRIQINQSGRLEIGNFDTNRISAVGKVITIGPASTDGANGVNITAGVVGAGSGLGADIINIRTLSNNVGNNILLESRKIALSGSIEISGSTDISGNLTASLQEGYVWVGNSSGRTVTVATSSFGGGGSIPAGTVSSSAQITEFGFVSSSVTASSLITASAAGADITFTKGDNTQFTITVATGSVTNAETASIATNALDIIVNVKNTTGVQIDKGTVVRIIGATGDNPLIGTASWTDDDNSANTLGFVVTDIPNDSFGRVMTQGTLLSVNTDPSLGYTAGQLVYLSGSGQYTNIKPPAPYHEVRLGQVLRAQQNNGSIYVLVQNGYELTELHDVDINTGSLANNDLLAYDSASTQWVNKSISTLGLATTGSNVFTGEQTFVDAAGNTVTLDDISGSLVLVSKGVTSGSAGLSHITASANNQVNIIFKNNNQLSGSTTLSGSNNILQSPPAPTAGFRRQAGGSNIMITGQIPEVSSSVAFPVVFSGNYANSIMRLRGPVSSSGWTFSNNVVNGNFNVGSADATSANQAIAGGAMNNNVLLAAVNYNAYTTPLVAQANFSNNLITGVTTLTAFSSSIQSTNNIFNGNTFTVNNRYFGTSSTPAAQRLQLVYNVLGGINSSTLTAEGSNTTAGFAREVIANTSNGSGLSLGVVLSGDNSSLLSTLIHGSNLTVTGSSANNNYNTAGGAFIGRNNDRTGTKASSAETIFAVGTGTSTAARKTGFLIDSGSNTFVDGTFNVTGPTSFNGAVNITGSLTSSLTEGYVWVGGAGNISTLVATSSFSGGGGTIPEGTVSSSAQILGYNIFATTGSNTFTSTQTINSGGGLVLGETTGANNNLIKLASLNASTLYVQNSTVSSGYTSGSVFQLTAGTGSNGFGGSGSAVFQMDAVYDGNSSALKVGTAPGLGSYVQGFADKIEFAKAGGFPNTPATTFRVDATSIELSGSVKMNTGSSGSAGTVNVLNGEMTVNNGLVTSNSIILLTPQELKLGSVQYATVYGKTNGSFTIKTSVGDNLLVSYLIINPI